MTTSGSWNTASNWTPAAVPGTAAGDVVGLVNGITAARTVTINTGVTLGTLNIGGTTGNAFTLTGTTGGSLTFNNNGTGASIVQTATSGANLISIGFTLADNLTVTNNQVTNGASPVNALTLSGDISESGGARTLTKTGVGTVVLSGSNTYSGKTTVSAGILQFVNPSSLYGGTTANWTAANVTSSSGATLAVSVGTSNFTTGNVTTLLTNLGALGGSVTSGQGLQAGSSIGFDTSSAGGSFTVADAIKNSTGAGGGVLGVVKLGSGTLALSGLGSTAANNYTGTTIIDQGTLVLANGTKLSGGLTFGNAVGTTNVGTLDLSNASAEIGGALLVRSITGTNTISIGAGQSLTSKGNVQIGDGTGLTGSNPSQSLLVQGSGTWNVSVTGGTFRVGNASTGRGVVASLDASQLSVLSVDLRTTASTGGTFTLNENVNGGGVAVARLSPTTTIKAATVSVASAGGGSASGTNQLLLGTGAQVINANTLTIGNSVRSNDAVQFQDSTNGTLTLRDAAGTGRAAINLGNYAQAMTANSGTYASTLNVSGHSAELWVSTLNAMDLTLSVNANVAAVVSFDSGTFDATTINLGRKQSSATSAIIGTATLNIGSTSNLANTFRINTLTMAQMQSTTGTISAVTNIAGTTTSGTITALTLAATSASGGVAHGTLAISGGSTSVTNGITLVDRSGTPGTANATLSITGGSLSVGGNIATAGSGGTIASTVTLDGGSLNLNGFALGGSGQLIDAFNLRSGTLSNVGQFNAGATLVKTTSGTLALTGASSYTGATAVQAGVVRFNSVAATTAAQALGSGSVVNLGVAGTSAGEIDYYAATSGTLDKNVFALGSGRNRIRNSGVGTLTLSGTLTKDGTILEFAQGTFAVSGKITGATANSDLYVNGATVTLTNTNNDYNGPTYVYGGGTLVFGTSGVIPNGSVLTLGGTGGDTGTGTLNVGTHSDTIGGLLFGSGGGTLKIAASATSATAQLSSTTGTIALTGGTLDLTGSGTTAGYYRLLSAQSITGSFTSVTGSNAAYRLLVTSTSYDYQQRAVLGAVTVSTPASIIAGGSAAFSYSVANAAFSGGANLGVTGTGLANVIGTSNGTAAGGGSTGSISGLVFTGTSIGSGQMGLFSVNTADAYGALSTTGTVSVTVLDHALPGFVATGISDAYAQTSLDINFGSVDAAASTQYFNYSLTNLQSLLYGAGLTAGLDLTGVTADGDGFASGLAMFDNLLAGHTSSVFTASFTPFAQGEFRRTFTLSFSDNRNLSGASARRDLTINASVIVVPEPGSVIFAGIGIAMVGWSFWKRRRIALHLGRCAP